MLESDHHICDLNTGVVDVILHVDVEIGCPQQPNKCIAQDGVADVPYVGCFIRVDARVFN